MIWIIFSIMAAVTFLALALSGINRNRPVLSRRESASEIFNDQIIEVERDLERGIITADEARAAKAEVERRLLSIAGQTDADPALQRSGRNLMVLAALAVPALGTALYFQLGNPEIPSLPFAQRAEEQADVNEIAGLAVRLKTRLELDESGGPTEGWVLLGQTYMRMARFEDAAEAFAVVQDRPDVTSALVTQYGEALVYAEKGIVTPKAALVFDRALELDPSNPAGTYFKAFSLEQAGAPADAYDLLKERIEAEDGFRPWMESFVA